MTDVRIPTGKDMPMILFNNSTNITIKNLEIPVSEEKAILKSNYK